MLHGVCDGSLDGKAYLRRFQDNDIRLDALFEWRCPEVVLSDEQFALEDALSLVLY